MSEFSSKNIRVVCKDDYSLAATLFIPVEPVKGAVLVGPATGIKRQFYANFASFLAASGYGVLTYDNRGIGESLTGHVKASDVSLQCWGEKDMPAALDALKLAFPETHYHLIGHSAGGQLVGLMDNAQQIKSMFSFASSSGSLRNMTLFYRLKAHFFMNFFIPVSNFVFGHTKSHWVGMGEPLPKRVARQWRQWCNGQGYVKEAFGKTVHQHYYNELTQPAMWLIAEDDEIAIEENLDDLLTVFPNIQTEKKLIKADDYGLAEIGHMKFFSRKSQVLWDYAVKWLEKHS